MTSTNSYSQKDAMSKENIYTTTGVYQVHAQSHMCADMHTLTCRHAEAHTDMCTDMHILTYRYTEVHIDTYVYKHANTDM